MKLTVSTLTPWWTGDFSRNSASARETGILGSMRYWYEGLIRGFGGWCCDPTAREGAQSKACEFNSDEGGEPSSQLCPACYLFGCTGWRRRFRLSIDGLAPQPLYFFASQNVYQASANWLWRIFGGQETGGARQGNEFLFGVQCLWGENATIEFEESEDAPEERVEQQIAALLNAMSAWGAIGAKPQFGFGQFRISNLTNEINQNGWSAIEAAAKRGRKGAPIARAFHVDSRLIRIHLQIPQTTVNGYRNGGRFIGSMQGAAYTDRVLPCAFDVRYKMRMRNHRTGAGEDFGLRPYIRDQFGRETARKVFGQSSGDLRVAGRIGVSHFYRPKPQGDYELKLWGSLPPDIPAGVPDAIRNFLLQTFQGAKEK